MTLYAKLPLPIAYEKVIGDGRVHTVTGEATDRPAVSRIYYVLTEWVGYFMLCLVTFSAHCDRVSGKVERLARVLGNMAGKALSFLNGSAAY